MSKRNSDAVAEVANKKSRVVRNSKVESAESVAAPPNRGVSRKVSLAFHAFEALVGELYDMPGGHAKNVAWERLLDLQELLPSERAYQILPADSPPFSVRAGDEEEKYTPTSPQYSPVSPCREE